MTRLLTYCRQEVLLYIFAIFFSIGLTLWLNGHETVINPDAICYLLAAEAVGKTGIPYAMHLCGQAEWPFYSMLIYTLVQLSHLSYTTAAYFLDGFFSCLSVTFFILIVRVLGGTRRILWLAALVILLSHQFNSAREYIVRDHGFWAFYLASIWCLLLYFKQPRWLIGLAFSMCMLIATLFRIEGAVFLLSLPCLTWLNHVRTYTERCKDFFVLNSIPLGAIAAITLWLFFHPQNTLHQLGRVAEIPQQFQHGISLIIDRYYSVRDALAQHVLTNDSAKEADWVLLAMMIGWYLISLVNNLSLPYALLVFYAWHKKVLQWRQSDYLVIGGYIFVNVLITFGFLFERFFLSKRYLIAFSLVLMLYIPFALESLIRKWSFRRYRVVLCGLLLCIVFASLGGIFDFGYSKAYIREAGEWLSINVPDSASLYANDYQLMYYSHHFGDQIFQKLRPYVRLDAVAQGQWKHYDYLAFRLDKKQEGRLASVLMEINATPVQVFSNRRGDKVAIYKINHK